MKPGNVLLGMDRPRLIDFGIARGGEHTALTSDGAVLGTPGFLPPEQAEGRPAEPAGDVFSLGCLLAYAATGRLPFGTGTVDAVLYRTVHDEPDFGPEVLADPELTALLRTCVAKHPDIRPGARELDAALTEDTPGRAPTGCPTRSSPPSPNGPPRCSPCPASTRPSPTRTPPRRPARPRRRPPAGGSSPSPPAAPSSRPAAAWPPGWRCATRTRPGPRPRTPRGSG